MAISTIAAASGTDNDEQPQAHSSLMPLEEITPENTHLFLQQWKNFYHKFV